MKPKRSIVMSFALGLIICILLGSCRKKEEEEYYYYEEDSTEINTTTE